MGRVLRTAAAMTPGVGTAMRVGEAVRGHGPQTPNIAPPAVQSSGNRRLQSPIKRGLAVLATGGLLAAATWLGGEVSGGTDPGKATVIRTFQLSDLDISGWDTEVQNAKAWLDFSSFFLPQDAKWTSTVPDTTVVTELYTTPGQIEIFHKPDSSYVAPTLPPNIQPGTPAAANYIDPNATVDPNVDPNCPTELCVSVAGHLAVKQWFDTPPVVSEDGNTTANLISAGEVIDSVIPLVNNWVPRNINSIYQITDPAVMLQAEKDADDCSDTAWNGGMKQQAASGLATIVADFNNKSYTNPKKQNIQLTAADVTVTFLDEAQVGTDAAHMPIDATSLTQFNTMVADLKNAHVNFQAAGATHCTEHLTATQPTTGTATPAPVITHGAK